MRVGAAAGLAQRIELVDEDHALAEPPGLGEELAHAARAHAHVLLHEVRAGRVVEGHAGFRGNCAGEHGLAGPGRSVEKDAAGNSGTKRAESDRITQEVDRLGQLQLRLFAAGDVGEIHDTARTGRCGRVRDRCDVAARICPESAGHDRAEAAGAGTHEWHPAANAIQQPDAHEDQRAQQHQVDQRAERISGPSRARVRRGQRRGREQVAVAEGDECLGCVAYRAGESDRDVLRVRVEGDEHLAATVGQSDRHGEHAALLDLRDEL